MHALATPLFLESWMRLALMALVLAWTWESARRAHDRSFGASSWSWTGCVVSTWTLACLLVPALVLGAIGQLRFELWLPGTALAATLLWLGRSHAPPPVVDPEPVPSLPFRMVLFGLVLARGLFSLRNPPADVDSYFYHLPMIANWITTHTLGAAISEPPEIGTYFPGNGELLQMAAIGSIGRETLVALPGVVSIALLGVATRSIALLAGASPAMSEVAALALAGGPGVLATTMGVRIDTMLAAWFAVALFAALRYRAFGGRAHLSVLLVAAGMLGGAKGNGPGFAGLLIVAALLGRDPRVGLAEVARAPVALATGLLLGGFWFVRNLIACGNPLFPASVQLGPIRWNGILSRELMTRTTQLAVWREGHWGHLTPANLVLFYGPAFCLLVVLAIVASIARVIARRGNGAREPEMSPRATGAPDAARARATRLTLAWLGAACVWVFLVSPYSGVSYPARDGRPAILSTDNMRYLLPAMVALLPLAAASLSHLRRPWLVITLFVAALVMGLRTMWGHVIPGVALAAVIGWFWPRVAGGLVRYRAGRLALAVACAGTLALAATVVEPFRVRICDLVWDGYADRYPNLPASLLERLRIGARDRPIACVGLKTRWYYYGRTLGSRPLYVPVATSWKRATRPFHFVPDPRDRAERALWLANLAHSHAAFVVLAPLGGDCANPPIESMWCAADTARFRPFARHGCVVAYAVR